jgi:carbon-monoxide dehydrogenase small subunit
MKKQLITCTINGKLRENYIDPRASLSDLLREEEHLQSIKHGCDVGECGACTVIVNGEPFNSCIYMALWAEGKDIRTLEDLSDEKGNLSDIQQSFVDEGAIQCGFCTPGFIMSALPIIESDEDFTREDIRKKLSGNFCRCTGYDTIVTAVEKTHNKRKAEKSK